MATDQMQAKPAPLPKYEMVVEQQLGRAIGRVRFLDVTAALLGLGAVTLLYALVVIGLDRWLVLSAVARQAALILYLAAACTYLGVFVVWPLCQRVNPYFAAKQLEQTLPEAKNSVVNWLDLRNQELPGAIRSAVGQRAALDARRANLDDAISGRRAAWTGGAAGVLFLVFLITLAVLGPSQFWSLFGRVFSPFSAGGIRTRTQIELTQPQGDATVPAGQPVAFAASISGKVPARNRPDSPRLLFRYRQTDPFQERPLEYERDTEWVTSLPASQVFSGFWYKIAAGDAETPEYQVRVRSTPMVERFDVVFHYRPYTGWPDKTSQEPILKELRGTEVDLVAHTNRAVKLGSCTVESKSGSQNIPGERVAGDDAALRFKFTIERDGQYRIGFTSVEGETNPDPLPYTITALRDFPPEVMLTKPGEDLTLPANGLLKLEGSASDDLGVERMTLRMQVSGQPLQSKPYRDGKSFKMSDGGYPKMLAYKDAIELDKVKDDQGKPFPLQPKMVLEYWLQAADACDFPKPNVGESQHYKVTIAEPDKNQQKQQKEREQAKDEQEKHDQQQDNQIAKENEQRQKDNQSGNGQEQAKNDGATGQNQQSGNQGRDEQSDPKANEAQKKLENAFKDKDNQDKSDTKPPDDGNKSAEQKGDKGGEQDQSQPGQAKSKGDKTDQGGAGQDARQEPGQEKGEGSKKDGKGGAESEGKDAGKGSQEQSDQGSGKGGSAEGQDRAAESKDRTQQQEAGKPDRASGKDGGQNGMNTAATEPKDQGDPETSQKQAPAEAKGPGKPAPMDNQPSTGGTKPDNQPSAGNKDGGKPAAAGEQPNVPQETGTHGSGEKHKTDSDGKKNEGSGPAGTGQKKEGQKEQSGAGTGPKREGPKNPQEKPGGANQGGGQKSSPKTDTQPSPGQSGQKSGENATSKDVDSLTEQMKKEQGNKQDEIAKQLAQAAQNAKDERAREQAAKALQQAGRDPQTGERKTATPEPGPEGAGQKQPGVKNPPETKQSPDGKGQRPGEAKRDGGEKDGSKGQGNNGNKKQGTEPPDSQGGGKPTPGAKGSGEGKTEPGGGTGGQAGQRGDEESPDLRGAPPDPRDRLKKGELLLERFDKLLEKDKKKFLEDAKISEEDLQRLRDDLTRRKAQRSDKPDKAPRATGPGTRNDRGVARVHQEGKSRAADTQYGGPGSPPPELRDTFREFTSGAQKK